MPEPLSIATGVVSLLSNSYKFSKDIYELIDSVKSAPKHIRDVSDDLKTLYTTLGTLDSLLRDEQIALNPLIKNVSVNLEDALKNCVRVFREIGVVINDFVRADGTANTSSWMRMKWTFKEKEVQGLRGHLATYKATCMMVISIATHVRTLQTNTLTERIQEDTLISSQQTQNTLAFIIRRLEAIETQRLHPPVETLGQDVQHIGGQESEYNFRMTRFMVETASTLSGSRRGSVVTSDSLDRPASPSLAISLDDRQDEDGDDVQTVVDHGENRQSIFGARSQDVGLHGEISLTAAEDDDRKTCTVIYERLVEEDSLADQQELSQWRKSAEDSSDLFSQLRLYLFPSSSPPPIPPRPSNGDRRYGRDNCQESFGTNECSDLECSDTAPTLQQHQGANSLAESETTLSHKRRYAKGMVNALQHISAALASKRYHEGYLLKLDSQDAEGRFHPDRSWIKCFTQLFGTVLSVWASKNHNAAGLDSTPTFINLTDASIKMFYTLPTKEEDQRSLKNVLSVSTAGKNRYLLQFSNSHKLIRYVAAIRLAMFENTCVHEAYTAALLSAARDGKEIVYLGVKPTNRNKECWVRVRFGSNTTWRRYWCVIQLPDEQLDTRQRVFNKARQLSFLPRTRGHILLYDRKNMLLQTPVASMSDIYAAYAIFPQAEELVNCSTLVKLQGLLVVYTDSLASTLNDTMFVEQEEQADVDTMFQ